MPLLSHPLRFLLVALAGWINQQHRDVIDYLREENRVLREQRGRQRVRFTYDQRVRLAVKAKKIGRRALTEIGTLVTPDTLLAWHRHLIPRKYASHPGEHKFGHVAQAHPETVLEPHTMTDELRREAIALVERRSGRRWDIATSEQTANVLTMPR